MYNNNIRTDSEIHQFINSESRNDRLRLEWPLGPVLTMFGKSKSEKIKIKIGFWLVEVQNLLTTPVYFLEIAAKPKKSPGT